MCASLRLCVKAIQDPPINQIPSLLTSRHTILTHISRIYSLNYSSFNYMPTRHCIPNPKIAIIEIFSARHFMIQALDFLNFFKRALYWHAVIFTPLVPTVYVCPVSMAYKSLTLVFSHFITAEKNTCSLLTIIKRPAHLLIMQLFPKARDLVPILLPLRCPIKNPPLLAQRRVWVLKAWQWPTLTWGDLTLPSARVRFTSEFGMGSGGSTPLWPPGKPVWLTMNTSCIHLSRFVGSKSFFRTVAFPGQRAHSVSSIAHPTCWRGYSPARSLGVIWLSLTVN